MQNVTNIYIANLAFADVIIALFCIPFQFYAALLQRWDLPGFMCQFCPFAQILSVNVSIFTMVAISLDRYRAIMTPLRDKPTKFVAKIVIFFIWLIGVIIALPMGLFHRFENVFDESNGGTKPFCTPVPPNVNNIVVEEYDTRSEDYKSVDTDTNSEWKNTTHIASVVSLPPTKNLYEIYSLSLIIIQYVIPLTVISYVYIKMGIKLWMNRTPGSAQDRRDQTILQNKKRVIKMLIIVVCIFGICWLPWHLFYLCQLFAPSILKYRYINIVFFICHWLAMSNSCYNPFIYGIYSEKFKREFQESTRCRRRHSNFIHNNGRGGGYIVPGSPSESGLEQIRLYNRNGPRDLTRDSVGHIHPTRFEDHPRTFFNHF
ncbi:RYamide receptor isoform X2 [Lepeophtheirus salmonis]